MQLEASMAWKERKYKQYQQGSKDSNVPNLSNVDQLHLNYALASTTLSTILRYLTKNSRRPKPPA